MNSRYYFTLFVCVGVGAFPAQNFAQQQPGGVIDLRHRLAPPTAVQPVQPPTPTVTEKIARDRAHERRLQYRQRRAALAHVARLRRFGQIDFGVIAESYNTKKGALRQVVLARKARQQQQELAKKQALAEVKALAAAMRQRFEAEQRALAEVERSLQQENPNHGDEALMKAAKASEQSAGQAITQTEGLPLISDTVDLSYIDPIRRSEKEDGLNSKVLTPGTPEETPGEPGGLQFLQPNDPAALKKAAQIEAMMVFKKQRALERIKAARKQAEAMENPGAKDDQKRKLNELVNLYVSGKIEPAEYYRRRALIIGKPARP